MMRTILILGGTGVFGKRLARHLAQYPDIEVIVSSRTEEKAQAIAKEIKAEYPDYAIYGEGLNHQHCFREALEGLKPFAVVDCSGPFQTADYDVADTVLHTGSHLIDLADARNYLSNFAAHLEESADDNEVCAFTGASSSPTLSGCVVRHLVEGWRRVDTIDMCITPGGKTEVGRSAIEAIMTYAGEPVPTWRNGKIEEIIGWGHSETVDVPGLGQRRISPVETIDPKLLGDMYNVQSRVTFSAGLESWLEQWGMEALARLRKNRLLPHPERFTSFLLKARKLTRTFT
ncbi:MAG: saccharopine dehydrogenase NADP-binding domain-containing protein, partial [Pseudomonadota bacterium]